MQTPPEKLRGFGWALIGKGATVFYALVVNALIARLLDPASAGAYFLIVSFVGFGTILATLGTPQVMVRQVAIARSCGYLGQIKGVARRVLVMGLIGGLLIMGVFPLWVGPWLAGFFTLPSTVGFFLVISLWIASNGLLRIFAEAFRGLSDIRMASVFSGMNYGGFVGGGVLCVCLSLLLFRNELPTLESVSTLSMAAVVLSLLLAAYVWHHRLVLLGAGLGSELGQEIPDQHRSLAILLASGPLLITMLLNYFITMGDIWILGLVRSSVDVALYAAAAKLVMLTNVPFMIVNAVVPPLVAAHFATGELDKIEPMLRGIASVALVPAVFCAVAFLLFGKQLLGVVYGDFYASATIPLLLLTLGQLGNIWAGSCAVVMAMTKMEGVLMLNTLVSAIILIVGGFVLGRIYGVAGVAACVAIVNIGRNVAMVMAIRARLHIWCQSRLSLRGIRDGIDLLYSRGRAV